MGSYALVFLGVGSGYQVFGGYSDYKAALTALAGQANAQSFLIAICYGPAVVPPATDLSPQSLTPGAWVAVLTTSGQNANSPMLLYGTFASFADCQAWILAQPFPSNFVASVVNTPL